MVILSAEVRRKVRRAKSCVIVMHKMMQCLNKGKKNILYKRRLLIDRYIDR